MSDNYSQAKIYRTERKIEERFDAEHDLPSAGQPDVTWVDYELLQCVVELHKRLITVEARLKLLEENGGNVKC